MHILVYKRTHPGDPDRHGRFGIHDCMGAVRRREFDAVVGVGGIGAEPTSHSLDGKINWIGIGPHAVERGLRGPMLTFDHFWLRDSAGPLFEDLAPKLARRMYSRNARVVMRFTPGELTEVQSILALASDARPSSGEAPTLVRRSRRHVSCFCSR